MSGKTFSAPLFSTAGLVISLLVVIDEEFDKCCEDEASFAE